MEYSLENLTSLEDCNVLLSKAAKEKADLNFKKLSDERQTARFADTSATLAADLLGVDAELAAIATIIAALPEGPSKEEAMDKKVKLEYKKFTLENRMESYGIVALLDKQMDLGRVIRELEEVDDFIAAIEAKAATLT